MELMNLKSYSNILLIEIKDDNIITDRLISKLPKEYDNNKKNILKSFKEFFKKYYINTSIIFQNNKQNISFFIDLIQDNGRIGGIIKKEGNSLLITICNLDISIIQNNFIYSTDLYFYFCEHLKNGELNIINGNRT